MISVVKSANLVGVESYEIDVEADVSNGLPRFEIVGLPDTSVRESKDRVRAAIKNSGFEFPIKRITINLSPANVRKEGPKFDLSIAIAILACCGIIRIESIAKYIFIGELALNGDVKPVNGVLAIINSLKKQGYNKFIIPTKNMEETNLLDKIEVYPVDSLKDCVLFVNGIKNITFERNYLKMNDAETNYKDFKDVIGQPLAKRALEIAAAGRHNCIMIGAPGCGKTMLANRVPSILPKLTQEEAIEVFQVQSLIKNLENNISFEPPFRNPHHSISTASMIGGGGNIPKPGEISLVHNGVLFLDEATEFRAEVLEALRQPLEDKEITLSRLQYSVKYPADFMLIMSINPCPCGYYGYGDNCKCTLEEIKRYIKKLSGPIMDRVDIHLKLEPVKYLEIKQNLEEESSEKIRRRVERAREIQRYRFKDSKLRYNSQMTINNMKKFCKVGDECEKILEKAFHNLRLTTRAYYKILKLARTISDLEESEKITKDSVEEAIGYRYIR